MANNQSVVRKKIKPYPISATIEVNAVKSPVEVILVNLTGAIVRLGSQMVSVGEYFNLAFELPVYHHLVVAQVRVLKTYDRTLDPKIKTVERLAELHFQNLTNEHRSRINAFIAAIGQVK